VDFMADNETAKLMARIRRIRGQLDGIERSLAKGAHPFTLLQTAAACRGAMNGLMAAIIEKRIRESASLAKSSDAEDLIEIVRAYLK
jgi:DNA-binding FrmR family transcriptional regulator